MLVLLAIPVIVAVASAHRVIQAIAPSNLLARRVRAAAPTFSTAVALLALAATLLALMHALAEAVAAGSPGWLNLVVPVLAWDAIKFGVLACLTAMRRVACVTSVIRTPPHPTSRPDSAGRGVDRTHVRETSAHASW